MENLPRITLSQAFANMDDPRVVFREDDDRLDVLNGAENFATVTFRIEHAQTPPRQTHYQAQTLQSRA